MDELETSPEANLEVQTPEISDDNTPEPEKVVADEPAPPAEEPQLSLRERLEKRVEEAKKKTPKEPGEPAAPKTPEPPKAGEPAVPGQAPAAAPPAYAPNFKYKFAVEGGQSQEAEFPEYLRQSIKTKEQEDEVRTVFAKAKGLDFVKPRFERLRDNFKNLDSAHTEVMGGIEELKAHYQRNDFDSFFARLQIPQEKVLQWVLEKVNYAELPPEQRAVYDARRDADRRAWQAEQALAATEGRSLEALQNAKHLALDASLTRPDIAALAESFDARAQKPGAFREAIRSHGELEWYRSQGKSDLTPDQAIQAVIAQYGLAPAASAPAPGTLPSHPAAPAAPQPGAIPAPPAATPVIPNVSGRANTPVAGKSRPRTIAELRKLQQDMAKAQ